MAARGPPDATSGGRGLELGPGALPAAGVVPRPLSVEGPPLAEEREGSYARRRLFASPCGPPIAAPRAFIGNKKKSPRRRWGSCPSAAILRRGGWRGPSPPSCGHPARPQSGVSGEESGRGGVDSLGRPRSSSSRLVSVTALSCEQPARLWRP